MNYLSTYNLELDCYAILKNLFDIINNHKSMLKVFSCDFLLLYILCIFVT